MSQYQVNQITFNLIYNLLLISPSLHLKKKAVSCSFPDPATNILQILLLSGSHPASEGALTGHLLLPNSSLMQFFKKNSVFHGPLPSLGISEITPQDLPRQKRAQRDGDMAPLPRPELCNPGRTQSGARAETQDAIRVKKALSLPHQPSFS